MNRIRIRNDLKSSVPDPKSIISDPDPGGQIISDPGGSGSGILLKSQLEKLEKSPGALAWVKSYLRAVFRIRN